VGSGRAWIRHTRPHLRQTTPTIPCALLWLQGFHWPLIIRSYRNGLTQTQRSCGIERLAATMFMR
ncbi:TPA: hypothetical protein ACPZRO_004505, partial [Yersinia enterocolitica]